MILRVDMETSGFEFSHLSILTPLETDKRK